VILQISHLIFFSEKVKEDMPILDYASVTEVELEVIEIHLRAKS